MVHKSIRVQREPGDYAYMAGTYVGPQGHSCPNLLVSIYVPIFKTAETVTFLSLIFYLVTSAETKVWIGLEVSSNNWFHYSFIFFAWNIDITSMRPCTMFMWEKFQRISIVGRSHRECSYHGIAQKILPRQNQITSWNIEQKSWEEWAQGKGPRNKQITHVWSLKKMERRVLIDGGRLCGWDSIDVTSTHWKRLSVQIEPLNYFEVKEYLFIFHLHICMDLRASMWSFPWNLGKYR